MTILPKITSLCIILCWTSVAFCFDSDDVHPEINHNASEQSQIAAYLKEELNFTNGITAELNGLQAIDILGIGGKREDAFLRPLNHFHDPLQSWGSAGLGGRTSALLWAQSDRNQASWNKARQSYFQALITGSPYAYAVTFQSLGQLMHLVSDMAVPAHVRNDAHLEVTLSKIAPITHFEIYTKNNSGRLNYDGRSFNPGLEIFSLAKNPDTAPSPVSALFDTDAYGGGNPEVTRGGPIGLAEYTNANFLSEGTVFTGYTYPSLAETNYEDVYVEPRVFFAEDNQEDRIKYVSRKDDPGFRLAALSYWANASYQAEPVIYGDTLVLNDGVFKDYAERLVPKAVGYSSALLDYFFRGKLDVAAVPVITNDTIWGIMFSVKNITPTQEKMSVGNITVSYSTGETPPGGTPTILQTSSITLNTELPFEESARLYFWFNRPISMVDFETLHNTTFNMAYRGTLGQEPEAVIGKVFKLASVLQLNEDWNTLAGNYVWKHATADDNYDNGSTSNTVINGVLVKDNVRYADSDSNSDQRRYNGTYLNLTDAEHPYGVPITPKTFIHFMVNDMSIVNAPPAPTGYINQWQGIWLYFNDHFWIQLSKDTAINFGGKLAAWRFVPGNMIIANIYDMFQDYGYEISAPLYLQGIDFVQQLWDSPDSPLDSRQHMEVDYIRVIDGAITTGEDPGSAVQP